MRHRPRTPRRALDPTPITWTRDPKAEYGWTGTGGLFAIVTTNSEGHGWHLSVSHPHRYPTWDEIASAREALTPDEVTMAMLLPPRAEYVNVHQTCLHLVEIDR